MCLGQTDAAAGGDPLEALLSQLGDGEESEEQIQGLLESMMAQLMSKDVLYEPLKELGDKVRDSSSLYEFNHLDICSSVPCILARQCRQTERR